MMTISLRKFLQRFMQKSPQRSCFEDIFIFTFMTRHLHYFLDVCNKILIRLVFSPQIILYGILFHKSLVILSLWQRAPSSMNTVFLNHFTPGENWKDSILQNELVYLNQSTLTPQKLWSTIFQKCFSNHHRGATAFPC